MYGNVFNDHLNIGIFHINQIYKENWLDHWPPRMLKQSKAKKSQDVIF